jgi:hypothetical protein
LPTTRLRRLHVDSRLGGPTGGLLRLGRLALCPLW